MMANWAYTHPREHASPSGLDAPVTILDKPVKWAVPDSPLTIDACGGSSRDESRRTRILLVLLIVDNSERVMIRDVLDHQINCPQFERLEARPELIHNGGIVNIEHPKE